jgi:hypothetical protein
MTFFPPRHSSLSPEPLLPAPSRVIDVGNRSQRAHESLEARC